MLSLNSNKSNKYQNSELIILGVLLALSGGFLDAYTFFSRGEVFANAQTGNMVLLGINLAQGHWANSLQYLFPIISFALGIILSEIIRRRYKNSTFLHWRQIVLALEFIILFAVGFFQNEIYDIYVNVSISFVCAMQVQTFRKVHGLPYASTMCTGNLRSATQNLFVYFTDKDKSALNKSIKYFIIILSFIMGAFLGFLFTSSMHEAAIWVVCILLIFSFLLMRSQHYKLAV